MSGRFDVALQLQDGPAPGTAVVRHSFTHRLATICRNMAGTITAMAGATADDSR